jgi:UDP-glucose 4-epimerase
MSILITGGTGFLGSRISKKLLDLGENVIAYDLYPTFELLGGYEDRIRVVNGDVTSIEQIMSTIKEHRIKRIIHLAYILGIESMGNPQLAVKVNCLGTNNVFEAARIMDIERVLFASSIVAYGSYQRHGDKNLTEDDPLYPDSIYGACKALCEFMAQWYHLAYGIGVYVLRVGSAFGPGRTGGATAFVSNLTTYPALGKPLLIPAKSSTKFPYASVDDVAEAFVIVCRSDAKKLKHNLYNVGGYAHSGEELEKRIKELIPDADISWGDIELSYVYMIDNARLCRDTGFKLEYTMREGLKDHINEVRRKEGLPLVE